MQIHSLPAGGRNRSFPGNSCTQSRAPLTNAALSDITCKMKWKWHPQFSEDSRLPSEIQWYIKTGFPFWNVQCSCLFNNVKAFWNIYLWRAATNKSKYGKHLCHVHKLTWDFDFDVDVVVTITVATDPWNTFTREPDPLVGLDPRWDLQKHSQSE